jgi:hypothetical protein
MTAGEFKHVYRGVFVGSASCPLAAALAALSALTAARLLHGQNGIRLALVILGGFTAVFGLLLALFGVRHGVGIRAALPVVAGIAGAGLAVGVAVGLLRPSARRYAQPAG